MHFKLTHTEHKFQFELELTAAERSADAKHVKLLSEDELSVCV